MAPTLASEALPYAETGVTTTAAIDDLLLLDASSSVDLESSSLHNYSCSSPTTANKVPATAAPATGDGVCSPPPPPPPSFHAPATSTHLTPNTTNTNSVVMHTAAALNAPPNDLINNVPTIDAVR